MKRKAVRLRPKANLVYRKSKIVGNFGIFTPFGESSRPSLINALNQSNIQTMNFNLEDYDLGDLGPRDFSLEDLGLGDFTLGDFDLILTSQPMTSTV